MSSIGQEQKQEEVASERAPLVGFLERLRRSKEFEAERQMVRVVPHGLFVDERGVLSVIKQYQDWILTESQGLANKSVEKAHQWLFGLHPERHYLVEGKNVLAGFTVPIPLKSPQQFGLPYYLGSLLPTANYLHPGDAQLKAIKGIEIRPGRAGVEILVARRDKQVVISEVVLRSFFKLAATSRFLQRRYPEVDTSLSVCLKALVAITRRAREVPKTFPIIVPQGVKTSKTKQVRAAGKFLFIEERGELVRVCELNGRNLSTLLREELNRAPSEKLGSFKLTPKHRDLIGFYQSSSQHTAVHARAFSEFEELVRRAREPREKFNSWFTAAECFERFSSFYQLSQAIDHSKISGALERFGVTGERFRIYGGWIFVLSRDSVVLRTVAKHIRLPGHQRTR